MLTSELQTTPPLLGLVLVGGRSARMRVDKASLSYHGKPQAEHCLDLLAPFCEKSFLSCRADQATEPGFIGLPQIHDTFLDFGPLGGILSALRAYPKYSLLVIACDLPFMDHETLVDLVSRRDVNQIATAFVGPQMSKPETDGTVKALPEPLCAIYEPECYRRALELLGQGVTCPRKLLLRSQVNLLVPINIKSLINANDPEAYQAAQKALHKH